MNERKIVEAMESIMSSGYTNEEKSVVFAHALSEQPDNNNINSVVLEKIAQLSDGKLVFSQALPVIAEDETEEKVTYLPFKFLNMDQIHKFLDKMSSEDWDGEYFNDTFEHRHPPANMKADGVPRQRADFNVKQ